MLSSDSNKPMLRPSPSRPPANSIPVARTSSCPPQAGRIGHKPLVGTCQSSSSPDKFNFISIPIQYGAKSSVKRVEPGSLPVVPELVQSALELPKIPVAKRHPQLSLIHAEKNSEGCSGISVIEGISALEIDKHDCKQIRDHATFDDEDFVQVCECKSDREQDSEEEWNLVF